MRTRLGAVPATPLTGKAADLARADSAVAEVAGILRKPIGLNEFADIRKILIKEIRPDPMQPRRLPISIEMLKNPELAPTPDIRRKVESIIGLATSIAEIGLRTLVEVYADTGHMFNIIAGERRYWACLLLGLETVDCKVVDKPVKLRLHQLVENAQREELGIDETLSSLIAIVEEFDAIKPIESAKDLQRITGFSSTTAYRWWVVLTGPESTREKLLSGACRSLNDAYLEAKGGTVDPSQAGLLGSDDSLSDGRGALTSASDSPGSLQVPEGSAGGSSPVPPAPMKPQRKTAKGRKVQVVSFKTRNMDVARELIKRITGSDPTESDVESPAAIAKAFKRILTDLEKSFAVKKGS